MNHQQLAQYLQSCAAKVTNIENQATYNEAIKWLNDILVKEQADAEAAKPKLAE